MINKNLKHNTQSLKYNSFQEGIKNAFIHIKHCTSNARLLITMEIEIKQWYDSKLRLKEI